MDLVKPAPSFIGGSAIAAVIGMLMLIIGTHFYRLANESPSWPTAAGRVTESEVRETSNTKGGGRKHHAHVAYEYEVEGKRYTSERVQFVAVGGPRQGAREVVQRYLVGQAVNVRYSPDAPIESVLEPGATTASKVIPILGCFLCMIGGAGVIIGVKKSAKPQGVRQ